MNTPNKQDTVEIPFPHTLPKGRPAPFSSLVKVDVAGQSHAGKVRPNNEDHFLIARFGRYLETLQTNVKAGDIPARAEERGFGMLVADGIGGHAAGEIASDLAISTFVDLVLSTPDWILRLTDDSFTEEVTRRAKERFDQVNAVLAARGQADPRLTGLGTTLTAAWSHGKDLFIGHVGDSRVYHFRKQKLHRLTRDHTLAQALADQGVIDQQEVARHRLRHVLTNALGDRAAEIHTDIGHCTLEDCDCLMLCSDGLTDMVDEAKIAEIIGTGEPAEQVCGRLVAAALDGGGKDNVTVIVARYRIPPTQ